MSFLQKRLNVIQYTLFFIGCASWLGYLVISTGFLHPIVTEEWHITQPYFWHTTMLCVGLVEMSRIWQGEYGKREAVMLPVIVCFSAWEIARGLDAALCTALLVYCARGFNIRFVCTGCAIIVGTLTCVVFGNCFAGNFPDLIFVMGERTRHALGFYYVLVPSQYVFTITLVVCWLRADRMRIWEFAVLAAINIYVYTLAVSRTTFILAMSALVITALYKLFTFKEWPVKLISSVLVWAFPFFLLLTIVVLFVYGTGEGPLYELVLKLDHFIEARIRLGYNGFMNHGITLFGQDVLLIGSGSRDSGEYNYIDNAFVQAAVIRGALYTITLISLNTATAWWANREGDYMLVAMLALTAVQFFVDDLSLNPNYNILMFTFAFLGTPHTNTARDFGRPTRSGRHYGHIAQSEKP